jgi:hypothetical protein
LLKKHLSFGSRLSAINRKLSDCRDFVTYFIAFKKELTMKMKVMLFVGCLMHLSVLAQPRLSAAMTEAEVKAFEAEEGQCVKKTKVARLLEFTRHYKVYSETLFEVYEEMPAALKYQDKQKLRNLHDQVRRLEKPLVIGLCLQSANFAEVKAAADNVKKAQTGLNEFLVYARQGVASAPLLMQYLSAEANSKAVLKSLNTAAKRAQ